MCSSDLTACLKVTFFDKRGGSCPEEDRGCFFQLKLFPENLDGAIISGDICIFIAIYFTNLKQIM